MAEKEKFPGLDAVRARAARPGPRKKAGRPKRHYTPEELAAMPPSHRRRALGVASVPVMTGQGITYTATPKKLTAELIEELVKHLSSGAPLVRCAGAVGVAKGTIGEWMAKGLDPANRGTLYARLAESVERAREAFAVATYAVIASGRKGWQGRAYLADRILGELAPPKKQLEHSGPGGSPIRIVPASVDIPAEIPDDHPSVTKGAKPAASTPRGAAAHLNGKANGAKAGAPVLPLPDEEDPD